MPMPVELKSLMLKFNQIGCLLSEDKVLSGDAALIAEQKMVIAELNKIYAHQGTAFSHSRAGNARRHATWRP